MTCSGGSVEQFGSKLVMQVMQADKTNPVNCSQTHAFLFLCFIVQEELDQAVPAV